MITKYYFYEIKWLCRLNRKTENRHEHDNKAQEGEKSSALMGNIIDGSTTKGKREIIITVAQGFSYVPAPAASFIDVAGSAPLSSAEPTINCIHALAIKTASSARDKSKMNVIAIAIVGNILSVSLSSAGHEQHEHPLSAKKSAANQNAMISVMREKYCYRRQEHRC
jgi:hypothetical protein